MENIKFYRGERATNAGVMLTDIWNWNYGQLESAHDYIQWLFPTNELSMFNEHSVQLTEEEIKVFQSDMQLQGKLKESFNLMVDFYGMNVETDTLVEVAYNQETKVATYAPSVILEWQQPGGSHKNPQWWLTHFNHNMLRITRILTSLRLCGLNHHAMALFDTLMQHRDKISGNTHEFWHDAVHGQAR